MMNYIGSRNKNLKVSASLGILKGICDDGGLYVPETIPKLDKTLEELKNLNYNELAYEILKLYLTDFSEEELKNCINSAYDEKFDDINIAPIKKCGEVTFLELFP